MKNMIYGFLFLSLLSGCSNIPDEPISVTLSDVALAKAFDEDSTFKETYYLVDSLKTSVLKTSDTLAKWNNVTYRGLHKILTFVNDSNTMVNLRNSSDDNWERKYQDTHQALIDTLAKWQQFKEENSLNHSLSLKLIGESWQHDGVGGYLISGDFQSLSISITSHKPNLTKARIAYKLINSQEPNPVICTDTVEIKCPNTSGNISIYANKALKKFFNGKFKNILYSHVADEYVSNFINQSHLEYDVLSVVISGDTVNYQSLGVPNSIINYWANNESIEILNRDIVKETIDINYQTKEEFWNEFLVSKLNDIDKNATAFFLELIRHKN